MQPKERRLTITSQMFQKNLFTLTRHVPVQTKYCTTSINFIENQRNTLSVRKGCLYTPMYLATAPPNPRVAAIPHPTCQLLPAFEKDTGQ